MQGELCSRHSKRGQTQKPSLPSKPENPVRRKIGKYGFCSILEHQFQAEVRRPSMQDPASKKLSAPLPSKACRKKSARILFRKTFTPPKGSMYPLIDRELSLRGWILSKVKTKGPRKRGTWMNLSMNIKALGTL